mgnify:CR=1 FL=1
MVSRECAVETFGVSLLSGGLDSTTVTAYAKQRTDHLTAITFMYGQSHTKEVDCAKQVASDLGVNHRLLDVSFLREIAWYSALTNPSTFPIPTGRSAREIGTGIPISYVPMRNSIFLTLAAAFLESQVLHAIEIDGICVSNTRSIIFMAPNAVDYSGYPDCRPEFYKDFAKTFTSGSKLTTEYDIEMAIETPIIEMSKSQIVSMAVKFGVVLEHTWSCYTGGETPCGCCDSCILRSNGFKEAMLDDPLVSDGTLNSTCSR